MTVPVRGNAPQSEGRPPAQRRNSSRLGNQATNQEMGKWPVPMRTTPVALTWIVNRKNHNTKQHNISEKDFSKT